MNKLCNLSLVRDIGFKKILYLFFIYSFQFKPILKISEKTCANILMQTYLEAIDFFIYVTKMEICFKLILALPV